MARQLVKSTVNLDLMMLAGQKPNSGAMIGALAGVLGEALDTGNKAKGDREKADAAKLEEVGQPTTMDENGNPIGFDKFVELQKANPNKIGSGEIDMSSLEVPNLTGNQGGVFEAFAKMPKTQKDNWQKIGGFKAYEKEQLSLPVDQVAEKEKINQYSLTQPPGFVYDENDPLHVRGYEGSRFNKVNPLTIERQKDNSPFERRQTSFNSPDAQSFNQNVNAAGKEPVGSRDTSSQYTKGKTFVEKRRTIQMHSSLGELGQAAAEGWNISVERDNYEKQIEADLKDFRSDEWKAAGEEADKNALFDKGFVDAMGSYKTAYGQAQSLKDPKQRATALATIETKMGEIKRENAKVQENQAFFKENYDNIALWGLEPEQKDLMLAVMGRGGDQVGFVLDEGGNFTIAGKTKNDTPMRYSPADIDKLFANLPMKRDFYEESFAISKAIKAEGFEIKELDANGIKTSKNVPFEEFEKQIAGQVEAAIFADGDKSGKGIASRMPAFQGKNGLRAWKEGMKKPEFLEDGEPNPQHPYNIVRKNMTEAIYNDLGGYEAARDESVTSMYTNQQNQKNKIAAEERAAERRRSSARGSKESKSNYLAAATDILKDQSSFENIKKEYFADGSTTTKEEFYNVFPGIAKLVGTKNIKDLKIEGNKVSFYGNTTSSTNAEGKQSNKVDITGSLDLNAPYDVLLQQIANVIEQNDYAQVQKPGEQDISTYNFNIQ